MQAKQLALNAEISALKGERSKRTAEVLDVASTLAAGFHPPETSVEALARTPTGTPTGRPPGPRRLLDSLPQEQSPGRKPLYREMGITPFSPLPVHAPAESTGAPAGSTAATGMDRGGSPRQPSREVSPRGVDKPGTGELATREASPAQRTPQETEPASSARCTGAGDGRAIEVRGRNGVHTLTLVPRAPEETEEQTAARCLQEALTPAGEVGRHETVTTDQPPGLSIGWGSSKPSQHQPCEMGMGGAPAAEEAETTAPVDRIA